MTPFAVTTVDLARAQFATTSIYHFIFVPLTLGLAPLVAIMQTTWYRTGVDAWLRLTKFFGTLLLINFVIGVATPVRYHVVCMIATSGASPSVSGTKMKW